MTQHFYLNNSFQVNLVVIVVNMNLRVFFTCILKVTVLADWTVLTDSL